MLHADGILFNQRAALQYNQQMGPGWGAPFFPVADIISSFQSGSINSTWEYTREA